VAHRVFQPDLWHYSGCGSVAPAVLSRAYFRE